MTEVGALGAGGDDEVIEGHPAVGQHDLLAVEIDTRRLTEENRGVSLLAQDRPDRVCDLRRRERRGRHLVEQRLEEMEVALVDEGNANRRPAECLGGIESREATAEDDDVGARVGRWYRPGRIEDAKLGTRFVG